ncbi:ImmA/IrrE family metallo-endopeptidase [Streptomyces sp. NPDC058650]|uniref:ImmA/IrrE family metallo-endopeptidase n=1 Tax=Streptomyces sp. NPDC058650 TaxID=3346575 RepID=UPI003657DD53
MAASMGIRVHASHLEEGTMGLYSPDEARIYFDIRLTPNERRATIAHELGHAHYGHTCSAPAHERQAEVFAARLLIDPAGYAALERVNADRHHIADELGVTAELIATFQAYCLTRVRGMTYAAPKMGFGQWAYRSARA